MASQETLRVVAMSWSFADSGIDMVKRVNVSRAPLADDLLEIWQAMRGIIVKNTVLEIVQDPNQVGGVRPCWRLRLVRIPARLGVNAQ